MMIWWFYRLLDVKMELRCIYIFIPMRWGINDYGESFMMNFSDEFEMSLYSYRWDEVWISIMLLLWLGFIFHLMILGMCQWDEAHQYAFYSMYEGVYLWCIFILTTTSKKIVESFEVIIHIPLYCRWYEANAMFIESYL